MASTGHNSRPGVSEQDRVEIVRFTLAEVLAPGSKFLSEKQSKGAIILSTRNIKPRWVSKVEGRNIVCLTPDEIQKKANREGDFEYLYFAQFRVRGERVLVELVNTWARSKGSGVGYLSGGGLTLEYSRDKGKWVNRFVTGYVS